MLERVVPDGLARCEEVREWAVDIDSWWKENEATPFADHVEVNPFADGYHVLYLEQALYPSIVERSAHAEAGCHGNLLCSVLGLKAL